MKTFIPHVFLILCLVALTGTAYAENGARVSVETPPATLIKKAKLQDLDAWMQLPEEKRILIVEHWLSLSETTRPAFPLYRTLILKRQSHQHDHKLVDSVLTK